MATGKRTRESGDIETDMTAASEAREAHKGIVLALGTRMTLTDEQAHFLAQVSPYVANAASAEATGGLSPGSHGWREGASGLVLDVSPRFVEKTIALARAFCECERLDEGPPGTEEPAEEPAKGSGSGSGSAPTQNKRGLRAMRALVSAMIRDLTTGCPFDAHYVAVLEMTEKLESMLGALGAQGAAPGIGLDRDRDRDIDIDIARHFGKFPPTPEPHPRALVIARAMVRAARRYNASTATAAASGSATAAADAPDPGVLIDVGHWEIDAAAIHVYGPDGSTRILCGRNSPNGCAIQAVTLMCGLTARVHIELSRTRHSQSKLVMTDMTVSDFVASVSNAWTRLTTGRQEDRAAASLARFLALIPALLIDLF
jgi:hypothetical protein